MAPTLRPSSDSACGALLNNRSPATAGGGRREIRAEEAAHGLDEWPRLAMRRDL
jgi:hypothetical protein